MTALAGYWDFSGEVPTRPVARMLEAQSIYGQHSAVDALGATAFGRRLWSLTGEDAFDRGPLFGRDGNLMLVADARIDNREELGEQLGLPSNQLKTISDPQLILAAIEQWGVKAIEGLIGPFAIACWDSRQHCLTLARDAFGERPLHYHRGEDFVAFSSMPKGLHCLPSIPYAASQVMAASFLALLPETDEESFFEGISRVLPGHIVTVNRNSVETRRYWMPDLSPVKLGSDGAYVEAMRAEFDRAVLCRLRRNGGGVGSHLSAGLDSSSVAATAARLLSPDRLHAFTAVPAHAVVPKQRAITDEGPLAATTAALYPNIDHVRVAASEESPIALMDRQFQLFERPVLNPSNAVWDHAINDAAQKRDVRVLLTGQMGNFTISHDGLVHLPELLRKGQLGKLLALSQALCRYGLSQRQVVALTIAPLFPPRIWEWIARKFGRDLPLHSYSALRSDAFEQMSIGSRAAERDLDLSYRPWGDGAAMRLWGLRRVDLGVYIKGTLAGWGLDLRDPTADRRLIEFALRVPERQYILGGVPRSLARRAFADRLPAAVLSEKRRGLQGADWPTHLAAARQEIASELESFERCKDAEQLIDIARLTRALNDWPQSGWEDEGVTNLYRHALLRSVAAGHFLRRVARTN